MPQGGHVECVQRFALHFVVIHHGALAGHDFGHRVGEVSARARESFDDGDVSVRARLDQHAGRHVSVRGSDIDQMDGRLHHCAAGHLQPGHLVQKSRVERHECGLRHDAIKLGALGEQAGFEAFGQAGNRAGESAVYENQANAAGGPRRHCAAASEPAWLPALRTTSCGQSARRW